ncbi:MAG: serine hydrolase [Ruminococcaceae bacterium]|nr:serine hydrolase [Oscillospiraceae bacterium]
MLKKFSAKEGAVIYNNVSGNITAKFEIPQVAPTSKTKTIEKTDIDGDKLLSTLKNAAGSKAYSVAVSTTDGIKVASIRNTNAQNTYSVSKVYCVTAIGMLYDEGKIKTTETVGQIFKDEIKSYGIDENKWSNITVHDLMKHRVGFTQGSLLDIDVYADEWKSWDSDFLKIVLNYKIDGNKTYKYSDAAFYLLSRIVAKKSGQTLDVYLKSRLFDKLEYKDYRITKCPKGHPIGTTQFFLKPDDVVKLGRVYLNGGTYNGQRIISQDWVNKVIENGYELNSSNNGYGKGGMRGQYIYVNFKHNVAVAWLSETDGGTDALGGKLKSFMS